MPNVAGIARSSDHLYEGQSTELFFSADALVRRARTESETIWRASCSPKAACSVRESVFDRTTLQHERWRSCKCLKSISLCSGSRTARFSHSPYAAQSVAEESCKVSP